jgi:hypothetical protein
MKRTATPLSDDITLEYIARLRLREDELGSIIKGHLLIEYIINKIILHKCKSPKKILDDNRSYTFSVKLQLVHSMGLIPNHIFDNVQRINKIRNQLAHNLDFEIKRLDFKFKRTDGKETNFKPRKGDRFPARRYVQLLCIGTLTQLRNHYFFLFGMFPKYELGT